MGGLDQLLKAANASENTAGNIEEHIVSIANELYPLIKVSEWESNTRQSMRELASSVSPKIEVMMFNRWCDEENNKNESVISDLVDKIDAIVGEMFMHGNQRFRELFELISKFNDVYRFKIKTNIYAVLSKVGDINRYSAGVLMKREMLWHCNTLKEMCGSLPADSWKEQCVPLEVYNALRCVAKQFDINKYISTVYKEE